MTRLPVVSWLWDTVRPPPLSRVVVVELSTGEHACYDLRPGSNLLLRASEAGRLDRLTGKRALAARVEQLETTLVALGDDVTFERSRAGALESRMRSMQGALAGVTSARTLQEAKARVLFVENPVT